MPPDTTMSASPATIMAAPNMTALRRSTDLADAHTAYRRGETSGHSRLAGGRLAQAGRDHVSHQHFIDTGGVDAGTAEPRPGSPRRQAGVPGPRQAWPWKRPIAVRAALAMTTLVVEDPSLPPRSILGRIGQPLRCLDRWFTAQVGLVRAHCSTGHGGWQGGKITVRDQVEVRWGSETSVPCGHRNASPPRNASSR